MYTILIVEDEVTSREGIYQLLIQHLKDCTIYSAISGKDGYEKALQLTPDIIIADIQMPELNGIYSMRLAIEKAKHHAGTASKK